MMSGKTKGAIVFILTILPSQISASIPSEITINEISWMGSEDSASNEWIEIYNSSSSDIILDGWEILAEDGTPKIFLEGTILAKNYFLLERTDDETVPDVKADLIYKGGLNNKGEVLSLINPEGIVVEKIDCSSGWFAGKNKEKKTMERKDFSSWQTSLVSGGTPRRENGKEVKIQVSSIVHSSNIYINKLLPSPKNADSENEWIEIVNQNNFKVDLSSWSLSDKVGRVTTFIFPDGTILEAESFLVLRRPLTKITLNNQGDTIFLSNPNKEIVDEVSYGKAPREESFNRTLSGWIWSGQAAPKEETLPVPNSSKQETSSLFIAKRNKAEVKEVFPISSNHSIFLIALSVASVSGIIVLLLRKKGFNPWEGLIEKEN